MYVIVVYKDLDARKAAIGPISAKDARKAEKILAQIGRETPSLGFRSVFTVSNRTFMDTPAYREGCDVAPGHRWQGSGGAL